MEGQAYFRLFPGGDLPAAQRDFLAGFVCFESPSPLTSGQFRGMRAIQPSAAQLEHDARLIVAILGERVTVRSDDKSLVRTQLRISA